MWACQSITLNGGCFSPNGGSKMKPDVLFMHDSLILKYVVEINKEKSRERRNRIKFQKKVNIPEYHFKWLYSDSGSTQHAPGVRYSVHSYISLHCSDDKTVMLTSSLEQWTKSQQVSKTCNSQTFSCPRRKTLLFIYKAHEHPVKQSNGDASQLNETIPCLTFQCSLVFDSLAYALRERCKKKCWTQYFEVMPPLMETHTVLQCNQCFCWFTVGLGEWVHTTANVIDPPTVETVATGFKYNPHNRYSMDGCRKPYGVIGLALCASGNVWRPLWRRQTQNHFSKLNECSVWKNQKDKQSRHVPAEELQQWKEDWLVQKQEKQEHLLAPPSNPEGSLFF